MYSNCELEHYRELLQFLVKRKKKQVSAGFESEATVAIGKKSGTSKKECAKLPSATFARMRIS